MNVSEHKAVASARFMLEPQKAGLAEHHFGQIAEAIAGLERLGYQLELVDKTPAPALVREPSLTLAKASETVAPPKPVTVTVGAQPAPTSPVAQATKAVPASGTSPSA